MEEKKIQSNLDFVEYDILPAMRDYKVLNPLRHDLLMVLMDYLEYYIEKVDQRNDRDLLEYLHNLRSSLASLYPQEIEVGLDEVIRRNNIFITETLIPAISGLLEGELRYDIILAVHEYTEHVVDYLNYIIYLLLDVDRNIMSFWGEEKNVCDANS
jgi:hypothetical protein